GDVFLDRVEYLPALLWEADWSRNRMERDSNPKAFESSCATTRHLVGLRFDRGLLRVCGVSRDGFDEGRAGAREGPGATWAWTIALLVVAGEPVAPGAPPQGGL